MRNLVKIAALIYALFSLTSCSRATGDNNTEKIEKNPKQITFEGNLGIYIKSTKVQGRPTWMYSLIGLYKDYQIKLLTGEKVYKVDYVIEFDYIYDGGGKNYHSLLVATDEIDPYRSIVT